MAVPIVCKLLQKQAYDFLSQRYAIILCFVGCILVIVSAFHFGEALLEWSKGKYAAVFNSFSDNIAGRTFQNRLCSYLPIDVVYTWVNGSDPKLIQELNKVKAEFFLGINYTSSQKCLYEYCFQSNMVLISPTLPLNFTLSDLAKINPDFSHAINLAWMRSTYNNKINESVSIVVFEDFEIVNHVLSEQLLINSRNYSVKKTYLTTYWLAQGSVLLEDTVILTGIPEGVTHEQILLHLPRSVQHDVKKMLFYPEKSVVVLVTSGSEAVEKLLEYKNFSIIDKEQKIHSANLVLELHDTVDNDDISASRFEDNEELRYSLRSLEKHAPWIRHVYIVTNGQIPYWLALDNPRVTLVTHEEIFLNKSHLPTFSSPAIESHIHRISGLSKKFIYMNDDVLFGKDVWPEDFYTHSKGQKIYLSWPVPGCKEGCPTSWIKDGYCDKPCNNSECDWDGGDCLKENRNANPFGSHFNFMSKDEINLAYCNTGCSNTWLADRYCDQTCNVRSCAFDAGDCGLINYNQLYRLELLSNNTEYVLPEGETLAYFDLTSFLKDNKVLTGGSFEENSSIRVVAITHKYKVITVLLYPNYNHTTLTLTIIGYKDKVEDNFQFKFNLTVNTNFTNKTEQTNKVSSSVNQNQLQIQQEKEDVVFEEFSENKRYPRIPDLDFSDLNLSSSSRDNASLFPELIKDKIRILDKKLENGELTPKGYKTYRAIILREMFKDINGSHFRLNSDVPRNESSKNYKMLISMNSNQKYDKSLKVRRQNMMQIKSPDGGNKISLRKLLSLKKAFKNTNEPDVTTQRNKYEEKPLNRLDTFASSLRYVNKLFNTAYGYQVRKVPAHISHMIDVDIMDALQKKFSKEYEITSAHRYRTSTDMQFAFSYYYFLMSEPKEFDIEEIFDTFDTDHSGTWSDREIRTIITRIYKLPLDYESITSFENIILNCSKLLLFDNAVTPPLERYHGSKLSTVSKELIKLCESMQKILKNTHMGTKKHRFEILNDEEVAFKMIHNNISWLVGQLDDIRKYSKKFICLNDNLDYRGEDVLTAKAVLQDFYESLFPIQSQFELPHEFRNRFLHMNELREWRKYRDLLKLWTHICLAVLIIFTLGSFCHKQVLYIWRRLKFHRSTVIQEDQNHLLRV